MVQPWRVFKTGVGRWIGSAPEDRALSGGSNKLSANSRTRLELVCECSIGAHGDLLGTKTLTPSRNSRQNTFLIG